MTTNNGMIILDHPNLLIYVLLSLCILLIGCGVALIINSASNIPFDFNNSPVIVLTSFKIFELVIIKNLMATFLIISLSILGSRVVPILCLLVNGYIIGSTMSILNYNPSIIAAVIFPHGYIEFPLLIFTGACSFIIIDELKKTGLNAFTLLKRHGKPHVRYTLTSYLWYPYLILIVPGVLVAAFIEATLTVWNLKAVIGA